MESEAALRLVLSGLLHPVQADLERRTRGAQNWPQPGWCQRSISKDIILTHHNLLFAECECRYEVVYVNVAIVKTHLEISGQATQDCRQVL